MDSQSEYGVVGLPCKARIPHYLVGYVAQNSPENSFSHKVIRNILIRAVTTAMINSEISVLCSQG